MTLIVLKYCSSQNGTAYFAIEFSICLKYDNNGDGGGGGVGIKSTEETCFRLIDFRCFPNKAITPANIISKPVDNIKGKKIAPPEVLRNRISNNEIGKRDLYIINRSYVYNAS